VTRFTLRELAAAETADTDHPEVKAAVKRLAMKAQRCTDAMLDHPGSWEPRARPAVRQLR
jgi:hypothetical protein